MLYFLSPIWKGDGEWKVRMGQEGGFDYFCGMILHSFYHLP